MVLSLDRKRFFAALGLFVLWVALLVGLAIVSANRPAARNAPVNQPTSSGEMPTDGNEK